MALGLSNEDVGALATTPESIDVLEAMYVEVSEGRAINRVRSDSLVPTKRDGAIYSLKSMDGIVPGAGVGAVRIDSDLVTWPKQGDNIRAEVESAATKAGYDGLVLLFSCETGEPLAILPDGMIQRIRV